MTLTRPLPGISFRAEAPPLADPLPRMDIAAFVGFAASGPLDVPVAVEGVDQFRDVFGDAPRIAWDPASGAWQRACLAPAVRDFFAQGGRRCWVVRVAGSTTTRNRFPIAGLLQVSDGGYTPAFALARSAGSWSDTLSIGASLLLRSVRLADVAESAPEGVRLAVTLGTERGTPVQPGDTIQIDFDGAERPRVYLAVDRAISAPAPLDATATWQAVEGRAYWFRPLTEVGVIDGTVSGDALSQPGALSAAQLDTRSLRLRLDGAAVKPAPGEWLTFTPDGSAERLWLLGDLVDAGVQLRGAWWQGPGTASRGEVVRASRATIALAARKAEAVGSVLQDLALRAPHPRYWGYLPDDETLYARVEGDPEPAGGRPGEVLDAEVSNPRFPFAGSASGGETFLPLGLEVLPVAWREPLVSDVPALLRDGLAPAIADPMLLDGAHWSSFLQEVFLDPSLSGFAEASLLQEAFDRRFIQGHKLTGIYSVLPLEEVSVLALPDAAQRGWRLVPHVAQPAPPPPEPAPSLPPCPGHDLFQPKGDVEEPDEAPSATPSQVAMGHRWELLPELSYESAGLLNVQRSSAQLAAARADVVAVLTTPSHFRARDVLQHRRSLGRHLAAGRATASYAALYGPWIVARESSGELRRSGPEGAVCGIIAARSLARGAWVAPANQPVRDAIALGQDFGPDDFAELYDAGVNQIRPGPRGFLLMGADTLSTDTDLRALGARRLLILLRRLALREGQTYVFAPHSPAFRRRVALGFERLLAMLFARGAFAGDDPSQAYRVVVDETLNTPASVAQGRFIVELRVAPSRPMTFITVRLVQTAPETLLAQER